MPDSQTTLLGYACHEWDYKSGSCISTVPVYSVSGSGSVHFVAKLAVDADGSPWAYHPLDKRKPDNNTKALDWLSSVNVRDLHGIQGQAGAKGPADGFYISGTSLADRNFPSNDTRRWVDASEVPYVVLCGSAFPWHPSRVGSLGCLAYVVDTKTGHSTGAIYADNGRAVGEGSVALALRLGLRPFYKDLSPKVAGFGGTRFFYLMFPDPSIPPPWSASQIEAAARKAFDAWGGEKQLKSIIPGLPLLKGPANAMPTTSHGATKKEVERPDLERPYGRDADQAKSDFQ